MANAWVSDHPWATVYDWLVEHERVGHGIARLGAGTDFGLLFSAAAAIGDVAPGGAVLDVPCGGGVALRGLRPGQDVRFVAADIAPAMLDRTRAAARRRGVDALVETVEADVAALPFEDASFDLVVCFTGLHCFPEPRASVTELARVTRPGGRLTGSAFLTDAGPRHAPMRLVGRAAGLLGPGATRRQLRAWLLQDGFTDLVLRGSGGLTYFTARRAAAD